MIDPKKPLGTNYVLSEADREKFLLLWKEYAHILPMPRSDRASFPDHEEHQTSEGYVAEAPSGGIPALDSDGTGTGTSPVPSSAMCQIYQIIKVNGYSETIPVTGLTREVFNVLSTAIGEGEKFPILRDKYGKWLVASAPPTTTQILYNSIYYGTQIVSSNTPGSGPVPITSVTCSSGSWLVQVGLATQIQEAGSDPVYTCTFKVYALVCDTDTGLTGTGSGLDVTDIVTTHPTTGITVNRMREVTIPPNPEFIGAAFSSGGYVWPISINRTRRIAVGYRYDCVAAAGFNNGVLIHAFVKAERVGDYDANFEADRT